MHQKCLGQIYMSSLLSRYSFTGFEAAPAPRQTLKAAIDCVGRGLHSGTEVRLRLVPAAAGNGIVFHRTDLNRKIPARFDYVSDTRLCTMISLPGHPDVSVGTIEHLMAALVASRIDDVTIEINGPELPILDGSAAPYLFLIQSAGVVEHGGEPSYIEILRPVRVENGEAFAELRPHSPGAYASHGLDLSLAIDFPAPAIGRQAFSMTLTPESFADDLASARTFTMAGEIEALRKVGLAKGGSLANAIVVEGAQVLNPEGLRWEDEFVRHKLLDVVGDLALAGAPLVGRFVGNRTGHTLNNRVLHSLFADADNYQVVGPSFAGSPLQLPAAAAPV
jgi:UDP-3-O-[3-hydroxymyristoyl] N-acetylglucosamine deacetylase